MCKQLGCLLSLVALVGCGVVDPDTYKKSGSSYGRDDGWYENSSHDTHLMVSGSSVYSISSTGAVGPSGDLTLSSGAGALTFSGSSASVVLPDNSATSLLMGSTGQLGLMTFDTANGTETVVINGTTTQDAFHVNVGDAQFDEDVSVSSDVSIAGGAGALTLSDSASSMVVPDNDATAMLFGSTGQLGLMTLDTVDGTETVVINGTTSTDAFHVNVGDAQFDEDVAVTGGVSSATLTASTSLESPIVASALQVIRFCGNGINGATASYMGPVLLDDTEADTAFGGAGCDALDNTTEATADAPWHSSFAFKPVAMVCVGRCTGASAANDAITYQLRDDTADVAGMACTATAWTGDDNVQQCSVRDATPATVAANSAIAIKMSGTDDACTDASDDFECLLYVSF